MGGRGRERERERERQKLEIMGRLGIHMQFIVHTSLPSIYPQIKT